MKPLQMKSLQVFSIIQIIYFAWVIVVKTQLQDQKYFQTGVSIVFSMLYIPIQRLLSKCTEQTQSSSEILYNSLNIFCLACLDQGLQGELFLSNLQYSLLGFLLGRHYFEMNKSITPQITKKIARPLHLMIIIGAMNFTNFVLYPGRSSPLGITAAETLLALLLSLQVYVEANSPLKESHKDSQKSFRRTPARSHTEQNVESPNTSKYPSCFSANIQVQRQIKGLKEGSYSKRQSNPNNHLLMRDDVSVCSIPNSNREQSQQNRKFYRTLLNQFPEGILILNERRGIHYNNNQVAKLLQVSTKSQDEILRKLEELKNYQVKFKEQTQFQQLFNALTQKLHANIHDSIQEQYKDDQDNSDFELNITREIGFEQELSKASDMTEQLNLLYQDYEKSKQFQKQHSIKSQGGEKIKFLQEVIMLCPLIEDDEQQDSREGNDALEGQLLQITLKPYLYEQHYHILLMIKDVSVFNQYKVLQKINANKTNMLNMVAHELKTPLNCILIISQQLNDNFLNHPEFTEKYLFPINSSASQIQRLVTDLLDLAQLRAGKFKLNFQEFDLEKLLIEVTGQMTFAAKGKNIILKLIVNPMTPKLIKSDRHRISQIILNLISNSIKFTENGEICIAAALVEQKLVEIEVCDTGSGMTPEDIAKLFKPFGKLEDTKNKNHTGVGLGLMISNIMAQRLSNQDRGLIVKSNGMDQGSSFSFYIYDHTDRPTTNQTLQVGQEKSIKNSTDTRNFDRKESNMSIIYVEQKEPTSASKFKIKVGSDKKIANNTPRLYQFQPKQRQEIAEGSEQVKAYFQRYQKYSLSHVRQPSLNNVDEENSISGYSMKSICECPEVLIVDDENINADAMMHMISSLKVKCKAIYNGLDCLNLVKGWGQNCSCWIKIIILDIQMPRMDGLQCAMEIRKIEDQRNQRSYIIGCSGDELQETETLAKISGMDEYLKKPVDAAQLKGIIKKLLKRN